MSVFYPTVCPCSDVSSAQEDRHPKSYPLRGLVVCRQGRATGMLSPQLRSESCRCMRRATRLPAGAALSKTSWAPHYVICQCLSLSARHLAQFPGKDVYKQLMMISNELSKSSLELIDITIAGRHRPGMRREMMAWLYELTPIGKLRQP